MVRTRPCNGCCVTGNLNGPSLCARKRVIERNNRCTFSYTRAQFSTAFSQLPPRLYHSAMFSLAGKFALRPAHQFFREPRCSPSYGCNAKKHKCRYFSSCCRLHFQLALGCDRYSGNRRLLPQTLKLVAGQHPQSPQPRLSRSRTE